jgi:hypothetical protein
MKPMQTLSGYIRQHLQEIEDQMRIGISQQNIAESLEAHGYKVSIKVLKTLIWRARNSHTLHTKKVDLTKKEIQKPVIKNTEKSQDILQKEDVISSTFHAHNPSDLDEINDEKIDLKSFSKFAKRNRK